MEGSRQTWYLKTFHADPQGAADQRDRTYLDVLKAQSQSPATTSQKVLPNGNQTPKNMSL